MVLWCLLSPLFCPLKALLVEADGHPSWVWFCQRFLPVKRESFLSTVASCMFRMGDWTKEKFRCILLVSLARKLSFKLALYVWIGLIGGLATKLQTPIVIVAFPIIRGLAAKLQTPIVLVAFLNRGLAAKLQTPTVLVAFPIIILLSAAIEVYGSPMNAMVKSCENLHNYCTPISKLKNFRAQNLNSLAPPTRQSLKYIQLHNFGLVGPNFSNSNPWIMTSPTSQFRQFPPN